MLDGTYMWHFLHGWTGTMPRLPGSLSTGQTYNETAALSFISVADKT